MSYSIHALTQEIGEKFIDLVPNSEGMTLVKYRGVYVKAAIDAGWVETHEHMLMVEVNKLFWELSKIWTEANAIPNA